MEITKRVKKIERPIIFFENKDQQVIWECLLKEEILTGFWSKVKFNTVPYISSKTYVFPKMPGISFSRSSTSFYFNNLDFLKEQGYYIAVLLKLNREFDLEISDLKRLSILAESFIMTDFKDDNSTYRRIQVSYFDTNDRQVPEDYKASIRETELYFRNLGVDLKRVAEVLKDEPIELVEIRKNMLRMSEVLKLKVDLSKIYKHKESLS